MTDIICYSDRLRLSSTASSNIVPVLLYGARPPLPGTTSIGGPVLTAIRRLGVEVDQRAFDLLTIAMAVTAADTFVDRRGSADGWAREFNLTVPLIDPQPWTPIIPVLQEALRFLSGDTWSFNIQRGGPERPTPQSRGRRIQLAGHDSVCLFSGGLDSAVGVLDLLAAGKKPVLVSHSYRGDAARQNFVYSHLPVSVSRFAAVANPLSKLDDDNDVQMRTRSFNFIAYGVLIAATMAKHSFIKPPVTLFVPENGLIAINPPLTLRRIGALSTRTTHPYFLALIQQILDHLNIPAQVVNQYALKTKGEMLDECGDKVTLHKIAEHTVSCGKWKRTGRQCGKCVPCLIRRAAFHRAKIVDNTDYDDVGRDLNKTIKNDQLRDDLLAMLLATRRFMRSDVKRWVCVSGPLPTDRVLRDKLFATVSKGMQEIWAYLVSIGLTK